MKAKREPIIFNDSPIPAEHNSALPVRKGQFRAFPKVDQKTNRVRLFDHQVNRAELLPNGQKPKAQTVEDVTGKQALYRQLHKLERKIKRLKPFVRPDGAPNDNSQSKDARAKILKLEGYIQAIHEKLKHYHDKELRQHIIQRDKLETEKQIQDGKLMRVGGRVVQKRKVITVVGQRLVRTDNPQPYPDNWNGPTPGMLVRAPKNKTKRKLETENDIKIRDRFKDKHDPKHLRAKIKQDKDSFA